MALVFLTVHHLEVMYIWINFHYSFTSGDVKAQWLARWPDGHVQTPFFEEICFNDEEASRSTQTTKVSGNVLESIGDLYDIYQIIHQVLIGHKQICG